MGQAVFLAKSVGRLIRNVLDNAYGRIGAMSDIYRNDKVFRKCDFIDCGIPAGIYRD